MSWMCIGWQRSFRIESGMPLIRNEKAKRTVGYQIIRSADSIAANIAEGYGRYSPKDKANFYRYSRGSFEET